MRACWVLVSLLALGLPSWAVAGSAEDAIEYRQGIFHAMQWNFSDMGAMIQKRKPFDAGRFAEEARRLALLAQMPGEGFIKGSEKSEESPTRAAPEMWYQRARFDQLLEALQEKSGALADAAEQGLDRDDLRPYFGQVAQTCKRCHDQYRERD